MLLSTQERTRIAERDKRIETLEAALKSFCGRFTDYDGLQDENDSYQTFTIGELRRADEALAGKPSQPFVVDPTQKELYYIQNIGFTGNCLKWWRPDGKGYTLNLDHAWKVTKERAAAICHSRPNEDIPHPVLLIDPLSARHLNCETLWAYQRSLKVADHDPAEKITKVSAELKRNA